MTLTIQVQYSPYLVGRYKRVNWRFCGFLDPRGSTPLHPKLFELIQFSREAGIRFGFETYPKLSIPGLFPNLLQNNPAELSFTCTSPSSLTLLSRIGSTGHEMNEYKTAVPRTCGSSPAEPEESQSNINRDPNKLKTSILYA